MACRQALTALFPLRSYGDRFVVLEKAVGSTQYERLTLKHIRNLTAPDDKVLRCPDTAGRVCNRQQNPWLSDAGARTQLTRGTRPHAAQGCSRC